MKPAEKIKNLLHQAVAPTASQEKNEITINGEVLLYWRFLYLLVHVHIFAFVRDMTDM